MDEVLGVIKSHKLAAVIVGALILAGGSASAFTLANTSEPVQSQTVSAPKQDKKDALSVDTQATAKEVATPVNEAPVQQTQQVAPVEAPMPVCAADTERDGLLASEAQRHTGMQSVINNSADSDTLKGARLRAEDRTHDSYLLMIDQNYQKKKAELGC